MADQMEKHKEHKENEVPAAAAEAAPPVAAAAAPEGDDVSSGHDDAAQDIALFKKLIAQYLGDEHQDNAEALDMAKSIHGECMKQNMAPEEAAKVAGYGIKAAKIMGEKAHKESLAKAQPTDNDGNPAGKPAPIAQESAGAPPVSADHGKPVAKAIEHKESAAKITTLTAENMRLRESIRVREINDHLETLCRESGFKAPVTKAFRELVKTAKSTIEVDTQWAIFKEAFVGAAGRAEPTSSFISFAIDKCESLATKTVGLSAGFADCVK